MANAFPFNSISGDRKYKAEDWAWYFATFISSGVFPNPADGLQVMASDGLTLNVKAGKCFINGYAFRNPADYSITLETADGALNRIDRIVARWDATNRDIYIAIKKGAASASPIATAVVRSADAYELALADIYVGKGVINILQANVTDQRFNSALCGISTGLIEQIDASVLTSQFNNFFAMYKQQIVTEFNYYQQSISTYGANAETAYNQYVASLADFEAAFKTDAEAWLLSIKDIISADAVANLQLEIDTLNSQITALQAELIERTSLTTQAWLGTGSLGGTFLTS